MIPSQRESGMAGPHFSTCFSMRQRNEAGYQTRAIEMIALSWSKWIPLDADLSAYQENVANAPGFYRVRAAKEHWLVYIGQTGRSLRQRTRAELSKQVMRLPEQDSNSAAKITSPGKRPARSDAMLLSSNRRLRLGAMSWIRHETNNRCR